MASQSDPQSSSRDSYRELNSGSENSLPPPTEQKLVEEILHLLAAETDSTEEIAPGTLKDLAQVRARHPGPVLQIEGLMDLLQVLLELPPHADDRKRLVDRQSLLRHVSQTLLNSSQARSRIDALWMNLANISASS